MGGRFVARFGVAVLVLVWQFTIPVAVHAAGFSPVKVEYSADRYMGDGEHTMAGKVYYAPGMERWEMEAGQAVTIVRTDKKVLWTLMPKDKMYLEHKMGEEKRAKGDYRDCDVRMTDTGDEVVNGVRTKRKEMEVLCPDQEKFQGTIWLTKENIPMRMETAEKSGKAKKRTFRMELKNLRIGKQDPALFVVPAGYQRMEIPSFGGMDIQKMMKERASREEKPPSANRPAEDASGGRGRSYTAQGRSYTAQGRSYTAQPREKSAVDKILDPAQKIKNLLRW